MQTVQSNSQNSSITILMKVLTASRAAAAAHQTVHTHSSSSQSSLPAASFMFSCLHCSLSFLLYLPGRDAELVEESSRHYPCLTNCQECRSMPCHASRYLSVWVMSEGFKT
ncbi:hypothetical protein AMECASPLE_003721 [Ameca splendens]|uniref:Uncharacterized protein n=1 Tax=Ameca splendens TaxID=208324 RepID=A0ABV0Y9Q1_9TELE